MSQRQSPPALRPEQQRADPVADQAIDQIVGPWQTLSPAAATLAQTLQVHAHQWRRLGEVNQVFALWQDNACLQTWAAQSKADPEVVRSLQDYVAKAQALPDWIDPVRMARAETLFMEHGPLSCTLLFCSSLPECYVVHDLAMVLHVAGQLEEHTDHRIRTTAAMVFPVMMTGGMTTPEGGGVAQVLKVRLIHATIRNLILRGNPEHALAQGGAIPALAEMRGAPKMFQALFAHGWDTADLGLPCNQEELAYTLLTFGYVFLRSMRKLGLGLPRDDEEAFLHGWNVVGHVLGIERSLMAHTMDEAQALFDKLQALARVEPPAEDPRPALGNALMAAMANVIPFRLLKPFPVLLTRYLCGSRTANDLGLNSRVSWLSQGLFVLCMLLVRGIDSLCRLIWPQFSLSLLFTRVLGYHFVTQLLMDQTRPLKLPSHLLNRIDTAMAGWVEPPKSPTWMHRMERRFTSRGPWKSPQGQV